MLSVVYVSTAVAPFSDEALLALLQKRRANNARLDLSGLLLYKDGHFMQALEGPDDTVRALYDVIGRDPRHQNVRALAVEPITERQFPDWAMGFHTVTDEAVRPIPGYSTFMDSPLETTAFWSDISRAQWLLRWFRRQGL